MKKLFIYFFAVFFLVFYPSFSGERIFSFDINVLKNQNQISTKSLSPLSLILPDGNRIHLEKTGIELRKNGFTWFGKVKGYEDSLVVITVEKNTAYGRVEFESQVFEIEPVDVEKGIYRIRDFKGKRQLPFGGDYLFFEDYSQPLKVISPKASGSYEDGSRIDILILYTNKFKMRYSPADVKIRNLVDIGNAALRRSGINTTLNIVGILNWDTSNINENVDIFTAIRNIAQSTDIANLRNQYKADMVSLFRLYEGGNICGVGYTLGTGYPLGSYQTVLSQLDYLIRIYKGSAFNIVNVGSSGIYYCSDYTFIHEVGHNLGCQHDRDHSSGGGAFSYSYGYDIPGVFATIMSYDQPEIGYFSNPDIEYQGYPIGVPEGEPDAADNARTINETRILVANYFNLSQSTSPDISVYPQNLDFGSVTVGRTVSSNISVSNTGDQSLEIYSVTLSGDQSFSISENCTGRSLNKGDTCNIFVSFSPKTEGQKDATITITSNAVNKSSLSIPVAGEGTLPQPPTIVVSRKTVDFGTVENKTEKKTTIYIENISPDNPLNLTFQIPPSDEFTVVNNCGKTVGTLSKCSVDIIFTPLSPGNKQYSFFINSNDPDNPKLEITVLGNVLPSPGNLTFDPFYMDFGDVYVGESKEIFLTLKNEGDLGIDISSINVNNSNFSIDGNCSYIEGGKSCQVKVIFKPKTTGEIQGILYIFTPRRTYYIRLKGNALEKPKPKIKVYSEQIHFEDTFIGKSTQKTIYIENIGNADLEVSFSTTNKAFSVDADCSVLKPGSRCRVNLVFRPPSGGIYAGKLIISSNDPESPQYYVFLNGKGVVPKKPVVFINVENLSFDTLFKGDTVEKIIHVENRGNAELTLKILSTDENITFDNVCKVLLPGETCDIKVILSGKKLGSYSSVVILETNDTQKPKIEIPVSYTVKEPPKPVIEKLPDEISFIRTFINEKRERIFPIKNIGNAPLKIKDVYVKDKTNFSARLKCTDILPGNVCNLAVTFSPKKEGIIESKLVLETNIGTFYINLKGIGEEKKSRIFVDKENVDFGEVYIGSKVVKKITVENKGNATLYIEDILYEGSNVFWYKSNCNSLDPGEKCYIDIVFSPKKEGDFSGQITVKTGSVETPEVIVYLKGTGIKEPQPDIRVQPDKLVFEPINVGKSEEKVLIIKNIGNKELHINRISINSSQFIVTENCSILKPGATCSVSVVFSPQRTGKFSAVLKILSDDPDTSELDIYVEGTALEKKEPIADVSPLSVDFGQVLTKEKKTETVNIKNTGKAVLQINSINISDTNNFYTENKCFSINPGETCSLKISFSPQKEGDFKAVMVLNTNSSAKSKIQVSLKGRGIYLSETEADIDNDGVLTEKDLEMAVEKIITEDKGVDVNKDNKADISDIILLLRKLRGK